MASNVLDLRNSLLPLADQVRGLPGLLGLRLFTVSILVRTWSGGSRPGMPGFTKTDVITGVKQDLGLFPVKFRVLTAREVFASGGLYSDRDAEVGPITPPFVGSLKDNDAIAIFDPPVGTLPTEVYFNVTGPPFPAPAGAWFTKISQRTDQSFRYTFVLRKTAFQP